MRERILIVDDSKFMRNILKTTFEGSGYIVVDECGSGEEAIKKYRELRPDLVTLDIMLPGMTGLETLKEIIDFDEDANVIMISSMGQEVKIREAILSGARDFIVKPFKEEQLLRSIQRIL